MIVDLQTLFLGFFKISSIFEFFGVFGVLRAVRSIPQLSTSRRRVSGPCLGPRLGPPAHAAVRCVP